MLDNVGSLTHQALVHNLAQSGTNDTPDGHRRRPAKVPPREPPTAAPAAERTTVAISRPPRELKTRNDAARPGGSAGSPQRHGRYSHPQAERSGDDRLDAQMFRDRSSLIRNSMTSPPLPPPKASTRCRGAASQSSSPCGSDQSSGRRAGSGSGPITARQTPRTRPRQSQPALLTASW